MLASNFVLSSSAHVSAAVRPSPIQRSASSTASRCVTEMRWLSTTCTRPLQCAATWHAVSHEPDRPLDMGM